MVEVLYIDVSFLLKKRHSSFPTLEVVNPTNKVDPRLQGILRARIAEKSLKEAHEILWARCFVSLYSVLWHFEKWKIKCHRTYSKRGKTSP